MMEEWVNLKGLKDLRARMIEPERGPAYAGFAKHNKNDRIELLESEVRALRFVVTELLQIAIRQEEQAKALVEAYAPTTGG
jgi:hypothetical protein